MAEDLIRYDLLIQDALRGLVRRVLGDAAKFGLPGEHHFEIVFRTQAPGVRVPAWIVEKFPDEMKIILQHQFWDLSADQDHFEVGLAFRGQGEKLIVPFKAVTAFSDPSVEFSLRFDAQNIADATEPATKPARPAVAKRALAALESLPNSRGETAPAPAAGRARPPLIKIAEPAASESKAGKGRAEEPDEKPDSKVVSIDAFRKKP